jgi:hypothetical protein
MSAASKLEAHKKRCEASNIIAIAVRRKPELGQIIESSRRPAEKVSDAERTKRVRFVTMLRERIVEAYGEPLKQYYLPGTISQVLLDSLFPETEPENVRKDIYG